MDYELFNFVDPILSGSVAILAANGITGSYLQRGTGSLETPRVELQASLGNPVGHVRITSPSSSVFDSYTATLRATVVTNTKTNDSSHPVYVYKCKGILGDAASFLGRLPKPNVLRVRTTGQTPTVSSEKYLDITTITFEMLVHIRADAW